MKNPIFVLWLIVAAMLTFGLALLVDNAYFYFAGYVVLQYIVLATAWNILGGYTGYVNFGIPAFIALGAYSTVALHKLTNLPLIVMMIVGGIVSGLVGVGTGYLTLRLRGTFFSIATLAMAVVMQTLVTNWAFVGGSRGAYIIRPATVQYLGINYITYLFLMMLGLCVLSVGIARAIEKSRLGYGFATIRDDELAAEASGVPTLRLKLIATGLSGGLMGMAGAPLPLVPNSATVSPSRTSRDTPCSTLTAPYPASRAAMLRLAAKIRRHDVILTHHILRCAIGDLASRHQHHEPLRE